MIMNLYLKEIRDNKKSLMFWSLGVFMFLITGMSKYQGYINSGVSVSELFTELPVGIGSIFGLEQLNLESAIGFYVIIALYVAILLGVHAVLLGSNIFAKEETEKTAEFLFSKPISRSQIFTTKLSAALTLSVILNIITLILSIIIVNVFNNGPSITSDILFLAPAVLFIQLFFLYIGILFASTMKKPKKAGMISAGILMSTFILAAFLDVIDKYKFLNIFTPFKYFDVKTIHTTNSYNIAYLLIAIILVNISIYFSKKVYTSRDLDV